MAGLARAHRRRHEPPGGVVRRARRGAARLILASSDLTLGAATSRTAAGRDLGETWGGPANGVTVSAAVEDALDGVDVLVDYTAPDAVKARTLAAVARGIHVVIGTSGLSADDFAEIDRAATAAGVGVIAAGRFSITAAMAQAAALLVAPYLPHREIIDYASYAKPDAPSGTSREPAERLAGIAPNDRVRPAG